MLNKSFIVEEKYELRVYLFIYRHAHQLQTGIQFLWSNMC